jgi:membrane-bound metal-dependent hydrolase YbcI (DUF457 family)
VFIGHIGLALAAKKGTPDVSLGTLVFAAQFVDLLWPVFLLAGVERVRVDPGNTALTPLDFHDYPITHSLATTFGWGLVVGGLFFLIRRDIRAAGVVYLVLVSHWFLDFLTHRPDLPLAPGSEVMFGLGLWNSVVWTMVVELAIFSAGITLYIRSRKDLSPPGWGFWMVAGLLLLVWLASIFGPPPPSAEAIGFAGLALWVLVPLAHLVDRRKVRGSS